MPHFKALTVAFFVGLAPVWERFSAEFAPGGLIDTATDDELAQAWMPSTNDANEGALGAFRVHMRNNPQLTAHQYNAQAMYARNNTQDFMDAVLKPLDHLYVMQKAREIDESKLEEKI